MKNPDNKINFEFDNNTQIKDKKAISNIIENETRLLKMIFDEIPLAIFIYDCENLRQISANKVAEERFNCKLEEINKNGYQWFLNQFHPEDTGKITAFIENFIENKTDEFSGVYRLQSPNNPKWQWNYCKAIRLKCDDMKINNCLLGFAVDLETIVNNNNADAMLFENIQLTEKSPLIALLSNREKEILHYIGKGKTNPEIADLLQISENTVNTHQKKLTKKLNIRGKFLLADFAIKNNI
jgi:DNA-binding CsgD family transcriptional regulator